MTKREFLNALIDGTYTIEDEEYSIFTEDGFNLTDDVKGIARGLIKKLDERNSARKNSESTKKRKDNNENIKAQLLELMENGTEFSAKSAFEAIEEITSAQHATALFTQLVKDGLVKVDKKKFEGSSTKVNVYSII